MLVDESHILESSPTVDGTTAGDKKINYLSFYRPAAAATTNVDHSHNE